MLTDSIRIRLATWHTLALATLLAAFAGGTWLFLERTARTRADLSLADVTRSFVEVWDGERREHDSTPTEAARDAIAEFRYRDRRVLVFDRTGQLVAISDSTPLAPTLTTGALSAGGGPVARLLREAVPGQVAFATLDGGTSDEIPVRAQAARIAMAGEPFTVVALRSLRSEDELQESFIAVLGFVIPLVLILAGIGGYVLARASLAPIVAITEQAERTSAVTLHERLPVRNPRDELGRLTIVLNGLLERLEHAFALQQRAADQQRQFMADASHELRTPVAALCSVTDVALSRERDTTELREALDVVRGEGRRLGRIVEDLFLLARADAGQLPVHQAPLFLEELIQDCARSARAMAAARGLVLVVPLVGEAPFLGDAHLLGRLLMILLDNAIKYTPPGGQVRLSLARQEEGGGTTYEIAVEDTGHGVPSDAGERIFERFARVDPARSRAAPTSAYGEALAPLASGAGLGLAIARWIAAAHHGTVRLDATGPAGSKFVVRLPA